MHQMLRIFAQLHSSAHNRLRVTSDIQTSCNSGGRMLTKEMLRNIEAQIIVAALHNGAMRVHSTGTNNEAMTAVATRLSAKPF